MKLHRSLSLVGALIAGLFSVHSVSAQYKLTILHNNDAESQLINAGSGLEDYGGAARFVSLVNNLRTEANNAGNGVITLSSGDNFLAGAEFDASRSNNLGPGGTPLWYDALAWEQIGYDAMVLGNHDFDFGTQVLSQMISQASSTRFLSSNLDFSADSNLNPLATAGRIASSTTVTVNTASGSKTIGIVGATTPALPTISSPGAVKVQNMANTIATVQAEIDALRNGGADHVIFVSHLQDVNTDKTVINQLRGVDLAIAGGGDENLAEGSEPVGGFVPGDSKQGDYPLTDTTDADGNTIPIVTTAGSYKYLGKIDLEFDVDGNLIGANGDAYTVKDFAIDNANGVTADANTQNTVVNPVAAHVSGLAAQIIGTSEVTLDQRRATVRGGESNVGNLLADAMLAAAKANAPTGMEPVLAFVNGGGIRADIQNAPGDISQLFTFDTAPFSNFVAIKEITMGQLIAALTYSYDELVSDGMGGTDGGNGKLLQVSGGLYVQYDIDNDKLVNLIIDGRIIIQNGVLMVSEDELILVASTQFTLNGGDGYDFGEGDATMLGETYQQALSDFIQEDLGGVITDELYGSGADPRLSFVPEPSTYAALAGASVLGLVILRRRRA
ncbi:MAG: 5'-nucleotidase C-terminal domain-containing protein [Verrucomicrobiota bacterium JB022]|nr:5'-nucleotidase C-terminal domain-containing protein [Verrucomicrobiota bacterium JB022]